MFIFESPVYTVMSLLEAPCAKTSWRALLFRAILGITGALIVCFDIWWFKQVNNSETGFSGHHCDFEQHVPCLAVHVCMNSVKFVLKAPGASILWGRYYSVIMCRLIWGALLLGGALLIGTLRYMHEVWYGLVWHGMVRYDMIKYGLAWHGMAWYDAMINYSIWYSGISTWCSKHISALFYNWLNHSNMFIFESLVYVPTAEIAYLVRNTILYVEKLW